MSSGFIKSLAKTLKDLMSTKDYFISKHWKYLEDSKEWKTIAPNFRPKELASKGDGSIIIDKTSLALLQKLRDIYKKPLIINSAYRDPEHNDNIGGSKNSQHLKGKAFDIHIKDQSMGRELEKIAEIIGFTAIGRYKTFIHVDNRPSKANGGGYRWGTWND